MDNLRRASRPMAAITTVWIIYSICSIVIVLAAIFIPEGMLLENTPTCYSIKELGRECFMCGSTRSFIQFGMGNFKAAFALNKFTFGLFIAIIINLFVFLYYLTILKHKTKK